MALEIEGTIKTKLASRSGNSARGGWVAQDFVLTYQDGNYPTDVCITAFGQDRVDELSSFNVGDAVKVSFNLRAREYNGRWYNDVRSWRIVRSGAGAPGQDSGFKPSALAAPGFQPAPAQSAPSAPAPSAPLPTLDDMPSGGDSEDLPF